MIININTKKIEGSCLDFMLAWSCNQICCYLQTGQQKKQVFAICVFQYFNDLTDEPPIYKILCWSGIHPLYCWDGTKNYKDYQHTLWATAFLLYVGFDKLGTKSAWWSVSQIISKFLVWLHIRNPSLEPFVDCSSLWQSQAAVVIDTVKKNISHCHLKIHLQHLMLLKKGSWL